MNRLDQLTPTITPSSCKSAIVRAVVCVAILLTASSNVLDADDALRDNLPPAGFRALFNGRDLTGWTENKQPPVHWTVKDGELVYDGKGTHLYNEEQFGNFILLVDWKVPPNGNSGVFLRAATQVEINDADKEPRPVWNGTSGGLYPDQPPLKRAAKPSGEWNHIEIRVEKGKITVLLNGQKTVDAFAKNWGAKLKGPIGFQHHGTPLAFKNIYVMPLED
jgi:hypothetical protein